MINFSQVKEITTPKGKVVRILDKNLRVLWKQKPKQITLVWDDFIGSGTPGPAQTYQIYVNNRPYFDRKAGSQVLEENSKIRIVNLLVQDSQYNKYSNITTNVGTVTEVEKSKTECNIDTTGLNYTTITVTGSYTSHQYGEYSNVDIKAS